MAALGGGYSIPSEGCSEKMAEKAGRRNRFLGVLSV